MKKLSLDDLIKKSHEVVTQDLLVSISGGRQNNCHLTGNLGIDTILIDTKNPQTPAPNPGPFR